MIIVFININYFEAKAITLTELEDSAGGFIKKGQGKIDADFPIDTITKEFKGIGQILTTIGAGLMVAITTFMGIKYLMSPPDKQAALKQQLIGIVVSGVVIFGAYGIWSAIVRMLDNNL